jgi:putative endonuclease
VLYIGVTNDLNRRIAAHRSRQIVSFTSRYRTWALVYFEESRDVNVAIAREKQLKRWRRAKKIALIAHANPAWRDLLREDEA